VRLPVEVLVLEEEDRIVAADRGAQQSVRVERVRRQDDAQTGMCVMSTAPDWEWYTAPPPM
jgi:hypothetical protein